MRRLNKMLRRNRRPGVGLPLLRLIAVFAFATVCCAQEAALTKPEIPGFHHRCAIPVDLPKTHRYLDKSDGKTWIEVDAHAVYRDWHARGWHQAIYEFLHTEWRPAFDPPRTYHGNPFPFTADAVGYAECRASLLRVAIVVRPEPLRAALQAQFPHWDTSGITPKPLDANAHK